MSKQQQKALTIIKPKKKVQKQRRQKKTTVIELDAENYFNGSNNHILTDKASGFLGSMSSTEGKLARMVFDPAHLRAGENIPLFPDENTVGRCVNRVHVQEFNVGLAAGETMAVYSLPFFEAPVAFRWGDGSVQAINNTMTTGTPGVNPAAWLADQKVAAFRIVSKSMTIRNITPVQSQGGVSNMGRIQPTITNAFASPSGYSLTGVASTAATAINQRIVQGLPGSMLEISNISGYATGPAADGGYLVNKILNEDWVYRDDYTTKAFYTGAAPATSDVNSTLQFTDVTTPELSGTASGTYVTYGAQTGFTDLSRVMVSGHDSSDITVFGTTAPTGCPQTYSIRLVMVWEFLPRLGSDLAKYDLKDRSPYVEFLKKVRLFAALQTGLYPASYNDFSTMFNTFKRWIGKAKDFYVSHKSILKPALNLIPGVGTALDIVDRVI